MVAISIRRLRRHSPRSRRKSFAQESLASAQLYHDATTPVVLPGKYTPVGHHTDWMECGGSRWECQHEFVAWLARCATRVRSKHGGHTAALPRQHADLVQSWAIRNHPSSYDVGCLLNRHKLNRSNPRFWDCDGSDSDYHRAQSYLKVS